MSTSSTLMTVEQYRALPEPRGFHYELHHGALVKMAFPKSRHWAIQHRLMKVLDPFAAGRGVVGVEFAFRPLPEHEMWGADVAFVSQARFDAIDPEDNLHGAPELVIEVLSPSNTASEIQEKERMCLENGCLEFWTVNYRRKTVRVSSPGRPPVTYGEGETIPLTILGGGELAVSAIFD